MAFNLDNTIPFDTTADENAEILRNLQGNILSGHGRDHTAHIFFRLPASAAEARGVIAELAPLLTSAFRQEQERLDYKRFKIPGGLFATLHLSATGYTKLGVATAILVESFGEPEPPEKLLRDPRSNFIDGMAKHAQSDLGDPPAFAWEPGFAEGGIDAMLLMADDDCDFLSREARRLLDLLGKRCEIACVERGDALRNKHKEGIEHFGYVDGRSQPLLLARDFEHLEGGAIGSQTREAGGGGIDVWSPFEPLRLVLVPDPLMPGSDSSFGSFLVFRKLEQDVRSFVVAEHSLADKLGLQGADRSRAGAMAVGRFRDGTPLVKSSAGGQLPPQDNNFRFDEQGSSHDPDGLRCPFHAHIRKTNPRGDITAHFSGTTEPAHERSRRIVRRGIPYGTRVKHPDAFNGLEDLPSGGVGLLFMCYQANIRKQFAFMQRSWANNSNFLDQETGIDPIIGQLDSAQPGGPPADAIGQTWQAQFGMAEGASQSFFGQFVKMRGGEFFFTPSLSYLKSLV